MIGKGRKKWRNVANQALVNRPYGYTDPRARLRPYWVKRIWRQKGTESAGMIWREVLERYEVQKRIYCQAERINRTSFW